MPNRHFFATAEDLLPGLGRVDLIPTRYVLTGNFGSSSPVSYARGRDLPNLGVAVLGSHVTNPRYLVLDAMTPVVARAIDLDSGGTRYAFDQRLNPDSVVLELGGCFDEKAFISGSITSMCTTDVARNLLKRVSIAVTRGFTRVGTFWLGPSAYLLFRQGIRFVQDVNSPREYDLAEPSKNPPN